MINGTFWFFMNCIGSILKFVIVFGIIGFFLMLPFLLKGGWILGLMFALWGISFTVLIIANCFEKDKEDKNENRD